MRFRAVTEGRRAAAVAWLLATATAPGAAQPAPPVFHVHIPHEATAGTVRRTLDGAFTRLGQPACQQLFAELQDPQGQPLQAALDGLGRTSQGYLGLVIFYDGARHPRCAVRDNLAVASLGTRIVYICPEQFRGVARRDPALAELIVIHEVLHTLGLGENPPSSREITSQVGKHCRR